MKKVIYLEGNDLYLSKRYLKDFFSIKTIEYWNEESGVIKQPIDGEAFFLYKSIPHRSRKKLLPADKIISTELKNAAESKIKTLLHDAYWFQFTTYKPIYETESSFTIEQITRFSRLHSVFQSIIELKKTEGFRNLIILQKVFNDFFPGKYKTKQAFSQAILKAVVDGIMSVAMDKRTFGNNNRDKKELTPQIDYVISQLVACNGMMTNAVMLEKANEYFREKGFGQYSLSWMKKQRCEWLKNPEIYKARYGQIQAQRQMPYASLKNANYTHIQWQVDGVTLPFWEDKFHRSVLVIVIDNCSKKIIGYAIGRTENSDTIKAAIRNAVENTGVLPFELVMDNHSFTQTQSAFNFESLLNKVGATLTKTSNPRQKIIVERYIQHLNSLFKSYYGYLGQSIRSKSIEAIASEELRAEYAKNFLQHDKVIATTVAVIESYNNKPQKGKTPNQVFDECSHPHPITLSEFHKAELLPNQLLKKIDRGQINIMRGIEKFEYQLPAALYSQWNNETVVVTHDSLQDGIYLFNKVSGKGIVHLEQKQKINNAKAIQSDADQKELYKNNGRIKGILTQGRKQIEDIRDKALNIDKEAYLKVSALVTPKNIIKELEQNANLKRLVEDNGVIINELDTTEQGFDIPASLKPAKKNSNPFTVTNSEIKVIDPTKYIDNDKAAISCTNGR